MNSALETAEIVGTYYQELILQGVPVPVANNLSIQYQANLIYQIRWEDNEDEFGI